MSAKCHKRTFHVHSRNLVELASRVVYYFQTQAEIVYMLDIYAKNEKSDLTPADKRELRAIVSLLEESQ